MKQTSFALIVVCAMATSYMQAQTTTTNSSENRPAFSTIIPKLQLLKSNYPNVTEASKQEVVLVKDGTHFKLIGKKITSKDINDKLKAYLVDANKQKDSPIWKGTFNKGIDKLSIYGETLELQANIWLPETNIDIQAKRILMHGYSISTEPLPWEKAVKFDLLSQIDTKPGEAGGKAGDISVVCDLLETGSNQKPFLANGGKGESVYVPEMTVNYPGTVKEIQIFKFHECNDDNAKMDKTGRSTTWFAREGDNVVAAEFYNISSRGVFGTTTCSGYTIYDETGGIEFRGRGIVDTRADERITFNEACVPGKGGVAGKISLTIAKNNLSVSTKNGDSGLFIAREGKPNFISYGTKGQPAALSFTKKSFHKMFFRTASGAGGTIFYEDWELNGFKTGFFRQYYIDIPSDGAENKAKKFLDNAISTGSSQTTASTKQTYVAHLDYLQKRIDELDVQYSVYFQLDTTQRKALDNEVNDIAVHLAAISKDSSINTVQRMDCVSLSHKVAELSGYKDRNIDPSNNVAGYRPLLSLTSTMEYIKNNLKTDLKLFVMSDIMASDETQAKAFLDELPQMREKLRSLDGKLYDKLSDINKVYDALAIKAVTCDTQTQTILRELEKLEIGFKKDGESNAKSKKFWQTVGKVACKVGAVAASVIPYGQPVLGQVVGNGLNALADNIGDNADVVQGVVKKIDLSGQMKELAKKNFTTPKPEETDAKYKGIKPLDPRKRFNKDIAAHNEALADKKALYAKNASTIVNGSLDVLSYLNKSSATPAEIDREITKLREASVKFENVSQKLRIQNYLKTEIFSELQDAVQKSISIESDILKNRMAIFKLDQKRDQTDYNKGLEEALYDIRNESLKRLKWVEYQLVKSYEYTTLTPFKEQMPCSAVFDLNYQRKKATVTPQTIDALVDELAMAYDAQRMKMSSYILKDPNLNKYKTDKDFSRKVVLIQDDETTTDTKGSQLLAELNSKGSVVLDLQSDFVNEIIRADESHARIKDMKLLDVKFDKPLSSRNSLKVKLEILDEGILRTGKDLLVFKTGDPNKVSDIWTWELKMTNDKLDILSDEQSTEYKNLINFLITGETSTSDKESVSRFTAPPAWSRCRLSVENNNDVPMPKLTYLELGLKCDRLELSDKDNVVLDIKLQNAPVGVSYSVIKNSAAEKPEDTHTQNDYEIVNRGTSVKIKLTEPDSATMQFDKWQLYSRSRVNGEERTEKELTGINLNENTRILAIFKKKAVTDNPVAATETEKHDEEENPNAAAKQEIKLYESPSLESPVIAIEHDFTNIDQAEDAEEINGFVRVVYNGTQEAYIRNNISAQK